jgi:hypothetical protein
MLKFINSLKNLWRKSQYADSHNIRCRNSDTHKRRSLRYEPLEARELLSITLHWIGGDGAAWNYAQNNPVWSTTDNGSNAVAYPNNADVVVKFDQNYATRNVNITDNVQASSIEFSYSEYNLSTTNGSHIQGDSGDTLPNY